MHTPTTTHKNTHTKQNSEFPCQKKCCGHFHCVYSLCVVFICDLRRLPYIHHVPHLPSLLFSLLLLSPLSSPGLFYFHVPVLCTQVILCISIKSRTHKWEEAFHACFSETGLIHVIWLSPVASTSLQTPFFPMAGKKRSPLYIQTTFSPSSPRWRTSGLVPCRSITSSVQRRRERACASSQCCVFWSPLGECLADSLMV